MRVFYVLYLDHHPAGAFLDAARLVCDPAAKHRSHVTVRGPYERLQDVGAQSERVRGGVLRIDGPGSFFDPGQNTVYLGCDAPELRHAWDKPRFGYTPHISIYDGESREFAQRVLALLQQARPVFEVPMADLEPLVTRSGAASTRLRERYPDDLIERLTGEPTPLAALPSLDTEERLRLLQAIFRGLERKVDLMNERQALPACTA